VKKGSGWVTIHTVRARVCDGVWGRIDDYEVLHWSQIGVDPLGSIWCSYSEIIGDALQLFETRMA